MRQMPGCVPAGGYPAAGREGIDRSWTVQRLWCVPRGLPRGGHKTADSTRQTIHIPDTVLRPIALAQHAHNCSSGPRARQTIPSPARLDELRKQRRTSAPECGKEVSRMPFGRGWFGRGGDWGRGNPYPYCRFYPWLPRRWWAYGAGFYPRPHGGAPPIPFGAGGYYAAPPAYAPRYYPWW